MRRRTRRSLGFLFGATAIGTGIWLGSAAYRDRPLSVRIEGPTRARRNADCGVFVVIRARPKDGTHEEPARAWRVSLRGRTGDQATLLATRDVYCGGGTTSVSVRIGLRIGPEGTLHGPAGRIGPAAVYELTAAVDCLGPLDATSDAHVLELAPD